MQKCNIEQYILFCEEIKPKKHIFCTSNLMWKCPSIPKLDSSHFQVEICCYSGII